MTERPSLSFSVLPSIGMARVGNAAGGSSFYVGPEVYRGLPTTIDGTQIGEGNLRDANGALCRQAARFYVAYDHNGRYREISPGATLKGKTGKDNLTVASISWTVHLANKKSSWYDFLTSEGENGYAPNHPLRNPQVTGADREKLIIDPGWRTITGANAGPVHFDKKSVPPEYKWSNFITATLYPKQDKIKTLGELRTDREANLLVLGGLGVSGSPEPNPTITHFANNNNWYDNSSDGPVRATVTVTDGVDSWSYDADPAWVLVGPPAFAPQIANLVTLYDAIFDASVRAGHFPSIFSDSYWNSGPGGYRPSFDTEIKPLIERATLYPWVAAIPPKPHTFDFEALGRLGADGNGSAEMAGLRRYVLDAVRPPDQENVLIGERGATMMPYLCGDNCLDETADHAPSRYLRLTDTQYFFLQQWAAGYFVADGPPPWPDTVTRGVLDNCVGGAFSPGIEMGWICRNPAIYAAPFRIHVREPNQGPLSLGFDPAKGMEPGDVTRYMAVPWQADFNECSSNPIGDRILWWWPAQRPEYVYLDVPKPKQLAVAPVTPPDIHTGPQVAWLGVDFDQLNPAYVQFADDLDMVTYWQDLGFIWFRPAEGGKKDRYVEVQRNLKNLPRSFDPNDA